MTAIHPVQNLNFFVLSVHFLVQIIFLLIKYSLEFLGLYYWNKNLPKKCSIFRLKNVSKNIKNHHPYDFRYFEILQVFNYK